MDKSKDIEQLKLFKKKLSKQISIDKIILFGSRVRGKYHKYSDFDLIIVSKKFKNKDTLKRSIGFYKYWDLNYPVDFLCYTPEEFNRLRKQITIVKKAVEEGILV